jgi:hypothetical protein
MEKSDYPEPYLTKQTEQRKLDKEKRETKKENNKK